QARVKAPRPKIIRCVATELPGTDPFRQHSCSNALRRLGLLAAAGFRPIHLASNRLQTECMRDVVIAAKPFTIQIRPIPRKFKAPSRPSPLGAPRAVSFS